MADGAKATTPDPDDPALAEPLVPGDDLPFEELAVRYNFRTLSFEPRVLTRLVIKECERRPSPVRALDIGCGRGIARRSGLTRAIRSHVDELWGIEPDETIAPPPGLFDHHQHALVENADLPEAAFDVAYSSMVMEHVEDPDSFMRTVARCLRPGGVYLFISPNRGHYFTKIALLCHRLGIDELVLRFITGKSNPEYHYPVRYRFNSKRQIDACAERLGLLPPEIAYLEAVGPRPYLRGPLRIVFHVLAAKRRFIRHAPALLTIAARITKPPAETPSG